MDPPRTITPNSPSWIVPIYPALSRPCCLRCAENLGTQPETKPCNKTPAGGRCWRCIAEDESCDPVPACSNKRLHRLLIYHDNYNKAHRSVNKRYRHLDQKEWRSRLRAEQKIFTSHIEMAMLAKEAQGFHDIPEVEPSTIQILQLREMRKIRVALESMVDIKTHLKVNLSPIDTPPSSPGSSTL